MAQEPVWTLLRRAKFLAIYRESNHVSSVVQPYAVFITSRDS
jgi:hypothetical protein